MTRYPSKYLIRYSDTFLLLTSISNILLRFSEVGNITLSPYFTKYINRYKYITNISISLLTNIKSTSLLLIFLLFLSTKDLFIYVSISRGHISGIYFAPRVDYTSNKKNIKYKKIKRKKDIFEK